MFGRFCHPAGKRAAAWARSCGSATSWKGCTPCALRAGSLRSGCGRNGRRGHHIPKLRLKRAWLSGDKAGRTPRLMKMPMVGGISRLWISSPKHRASGGWSRLQFICHCCNNLRIQRAHCPFNVLQDGNKRLSTTLDRLGFAFPSSP